jgi:hypothetical protein
MAITGRMPSCSMMSKGWVMMRPAPFAMTELWHDAAGKAYPNHRRF